MKENASYKNFFAVPKKKKRTFFRVGMCRAQLVNMDEISNYELYSKNHEGVVGSCLKSEWRYARDLNHMGVTILLPK